MANYLLVYYGGAMETDPKKAKATMDAWMKWFGSLGKSLVDGGAPTKPGKLIGADGVKSVGATPVTGYTIVKADDLDKAVAIAKGSPQIAAGGQIGVYETMPM
jgi:hypothetical protein